MPRRVYIPGTDQRGEVVGSDVVEKGTPWEHRILRVRPDGSDFEVAVGALATVPESEAPDWSEDELPDDHPARGNA